MGPLDGFWHVISFFYPAVAVGCIAAALAKVVWRAELRKVSWRRLAVAAAAAGALALIAGLVAFGRDGRMVTYGLLCAAAAVALWWVGFRRSPTR